MVNLPHTPGTEIKGHEIKGVLNTAFSRYIAHAVRQEKVRCIQMSLITQDTKCQKDDIL